MIRTREYFVIKKESTGDDCNFVADFSDWNNHPHNPGNANISFVPLEDADFFTTEKEAEQFITDILAYKKFEHLNANGWSIETLRITLEVSES